MTSRLLPVDEWPRLMGTEAETVWPLLDPSRASILVVEDAGAIVGTWIFMNVLHAECLWIAPSHRTKASVGRKLWSGLKRFAKEEGVQVVATAAMTDKVRELLDHAGAKRIPGDHYSMRVH